MNVDIKKVPMVRVTWLDARDTETGWLDIKDILKLVKFFILLFLIIFFAISII